MSVIVSLTDSGGVTRSELAEETGLRLSSVTGRVNELLRSGCVVNKGTTFDEETGKTVELLVASNLYLVGLGK